MKKKINTLYILLSVSAVVLTLVVTTIVYYGIQQREVLDSLRLYAHTLEQTVEAEDYASREVELAGEDQIRITVVDVDGTVLYDNETDAETLDNHKDRPEIQTALAQGEGSKVRRSDTMNKSTFYYAVLLSNGRVLRVAREAESFFSVLSQVFPLICLIVVILVSTSIIFSSVLTRSIIRPMERMAEDMDAVDRTTAYKELMPFVNTIQKQHEDIMRSAQMRQEFTANVSHELKTPLTSISGYSELIENGMAKGEDIERFAKEIHKNAQRLLTLINDILRLSQLDISDPDTVPFGPVDIRTVADNCVNMLELTAEKHQVQVQIEGEASCVIEANQQMMEELIYNLCDNGIRYNNPGGSVQITIRDIPELGKVKLVVQDTGIGIPQEHQNRIFERFYRVDKSRSKSTGGTGLGLAIVKHIVSQHQAEMQLESESGKGTTITILFHKKIRV